MGDGLTRTSLRRFWLSCGILICGWMAMRRPVRRAGSSS